MCSSRGWTYEASDQSLVTRWAGDPFDKGTNHRARNVVVGETSGRRFIAFDYTYDVRRSNGGVGSSSTTYRFTVTALSLPVALPTLQVVPESWGSRLATGVGLTSDVDLESDAFNQRFRVTTSSRKFASDVLTPRQMEELLAQPAFCWRIEGDEILTWSEGEIETDQVGAPAGLLAGILDGIPAFVWRDQGYDPDTFGSGPTGDPRSAS
ncbi:MAG: hypothetical protein WAN48_00220 [Actinomycetes bacterium]